MMTPSSRSALPNRPFPHIHYGNTQPVLSRWLDTNPLRRGLNKLAAEVVVALFVGSSKAIEWQQKYKDSATPSKNLIRHDDVRYVGPNRSSVGQSEVVGGSSTGRPPSVVQMT